MGTDEPWAGGPRTGAVGCDDAHIQKPPRRMKRIQTMKVDPLRRSGRRLGRRPALKAEPFKRTTWRPGQARLKSKKQKAKRILACCTGVYRGLKYTRLALIYRMTPSDSVGMTWLSSFWNGPVARKPRVVKTWISRNYIVSLDLKLDPDLQMVQGAQPLET